MGVRDRVVCFLRFLLFVLHPSQPLEPRNVRVRHGDRRQRRLQRHAGRTAQSLADLRPRRHSSGSSRNFLRVPARAVLCDCAPRGDSADHSATLIGAAVIPLFLFARNRLGPYQAVMIAAMYVIYAPLHGANLYDFHYPPLGIGFVFWLAYLVDIGKYRWAVIPLLLSLSVREDLALSVFVLGAYFLLSRTRPRAGLALALVGVGYFLTMKMAVMPFFQEGKPTFVWYYEKLIPAGGPNGFGGVLLTIFGNPGFTLGTLLTSA
ncbi:MAG: DUF2079 domain-containing protein, partial [Myxococcales bacterium]